MRRRSRSPSPRTWRPVWGNGWSVDLQDTMGEFELETWLKSAGKVPEATADHGRRRLGRRSDRPGLQGRPVGPRRRHPLGQPGRRCRVRGRGPDRPRRPRRPWGAHRHRRQQPGDRVRRHRRRHHQRARQRPRAGRLDRPTSAPGRRSRAGPARWPGSSSSPTRGPAEPPIGPARRGRPPSHRDRRRGTSRPARWHRR